MGRGFRRRKVSQYGIVMAKVSALKADQTVLDIYNTVVSTQVRANNCKCMCTPPHPVCRENTYDTVGPKEPTAMSDHVAMETNPAYGVCS